MQITPKLLTLVKIFDSLNHSFNFYWQNNDSKNIHSKKNLIIHSSKIFIQKKKNYSFKKKFIQKKSWAFIQRKYSFKSFFDYSFNENIHFFEKCRIAHPYCSTVGESDTAFFLVWPFCLLAFGLILVQAKHRTVWFWFWFCGAGINIGTDYCHECLLLHLLGINW